MAAASISLTAPALAQPALTVEAMTDYRVRGLSWSDGHPAVAASLAADLPAGFYGEAWAAAARGSGRHGDADAAIDLTFGRRTPLGPLSLDTSLIGHAFPGGRGDQDYAEGRIAFDGALGPVAATVSAAYAPRQDAIGGDNLHLRLATRVAVIGTPWTLRAQVGRSSGDARSIRAARLRPDGTYLDWLLGADHIMGPLTLGVAYSDTDIGDGGGGVPAAFRRHSGAVVIARAALSF